MSTMNRENSHMYNPRFFADQLIKDLQERADYLSERYATNGGVRFHEQYCDTISLIGKIKQYVVDHEERYNDL